MEVLGALLLVTILSLLSRLLQRARPLLNLPPSPLFSLPLLGHLFLLHDIATSHALLQGLRHKLGPIFTLYAGSTPIIYITSAALAHEALVQKSLLFATRPLLPSRILLTNNFRSINSAPYGPHWRALRRNLAHQILAMPKILSFIPTHVDHMISRILAEAHNNEGIIFFYPIIRHAMFQLLAFMCFGFHMPEDVLLQLISFMDERLPLVAASVQDFYPHIRIFTRKRRPEEHALLAKQVKLYTAHIVKHQELQKLGQLAPGSYLETLLHMSAASTPLSTDDLVTLCAEFLLAGTDSAGTTLEWTMAHLVEESSIQSKLYDQIHDVVGDRFVEEKNLPNLPYLQAVIKETLRLHPPTDFLPHAVSELCKLGGYDIPQNAVVQFHVTSISRNAEIWEEPLTYKPERFNAPADVDIRGNKDVKMLPFGAGRRICPGLAFAMTHMELVLARLVQAFQWTNFPAGKSVDFTEGRILTIKMKHPLKAFVKERKA